MDCLKAVEFFRSVVMSLKRIPFLGKSGTSRISGPSSSMGQTGPLLRALLDDERAHFEVGPTAHCCREIRRRFVPAAQQMGMPPCLCEARMQPGFEALVGGTRMVGSR